MGWLSAAESNFKDTRGNPAPLYRIKYLDGVLQGEEEDLEEYEVRNSLPTKRKKGDCASKKKRKAATPAPAPTTTPVTTTASTTDKTRACKKKKQSKKTKKKPKGRRKKPSQCHTEAVARAIRWWGFMSINQR